MADAGSHAQRRANTLAMFSLAVAVLAASQTTAQSIATPNGQPNSAGWAGDDEDSEWSLDSSPPWATIFGEGLHAPIARALRFSG